MAIGNVLIIIMQHQRHNGDYMRAYELGQRPINTIWINFYHLKKYLINKKIAYYPLNLNAMKKIPHRVVERKFDACITIFNHPNGFSKPGIDHMPMIRKLKSIVSCPFYLLTEVLTDETYKDWITYFDFIFTNRKCEYDRVISLGFAANEELLLSNKDPTKLRILVDHPAYTKEHFQKRDRTQSILEQILNHKFNKEIVVRRFINAGIETVKDKSYKIEQYNRRGINILDAYKEYNMTDIFFVTHPESMGLSVIECAMAGCLIVLPRHYIKPEFLEGINYVQFDGFIDWGKIMDKLDSKTNRRMALTKTWTKFYDKMFEKMTMIHEIRENKAIIMNKVKLNK